jgi:hypothetical protein
MKSEFCGPPASVGGIGGETGTLEVVTNYDTGEISGFASGGLQFGSNGGAQGGVEAGAIWGLSADNKNYSGGSTTISGGSPEGPGGFISGNSGGLTGDPRQVTRPVSAGVTFTGSLLPFPSGNVSITNYTQPKHLGNVMTNGTVEQKMYLLERQVCKLGG